MEKRYKYQEATLKVFESKLVEGADRAEAVLFVETMSKFSSYLCEQTVGSQAIYLR